MLDKELSGDSDQPREVADSLKSFIEGIPSHQQKDVIEAEKQRGIIDSLSRARASVSQFCTKRHTASTTCPHHKPPTKAIAIRTAQEGEEEEDGSAFSIAALSPDV